jgi:hypothetical protein
MTYPVGVAAWSLPLLWLAVGELHLQLRGGGPVERPLSGRVLGTDVRYGEPYVRAPWKSSTAAQKDADEQDSDRMPLWSAWVGVLQPLPLKVRTPELSAARQNVADAHDTELIGRLSIVAAWLHALPLNVSACPAVCEPSPEPTATQKEADGHDTEVPEKAAAADGAAKDASSAQTMGARARSSVLGWAEAFKSFARASAKAACNRVPATGFPPGRRITIRAAWDHSKN